MQVDDVHALLAESAQQDMTRVSTTIAPGELILLQVEPGDSFETVLAGISQQQHPVILVLPEQGPALSRAEHFAQLKGVQAPPIVGIIVPSSRMNALARFAYQYGITFFSSLEKALTAGASLRRAFSQDESSEFVARSRQTGDLPPVNTYAGTAGFPQPPYIIQDQEQGNGSMSGPIGPENWFTYGETPLPETILPNPSINTQTAAPPRRAAGLQGKKLALIALVGVIVLVLVVVLLPLLLAAPPTTLTGSPHQPVAATSVGTIYFSNSGQLDPLGTQGLNDVVTIDLHHLRAVPAGKADYAWLLPDKTDDQTQPVLLGTLSVTGGATHVTYTSPNHTNLLAKFSRFLVTEEDAANRPVTPALDQTAWRYLGEIPSTPTPGDEKHYSLLSHLRHLLAKDPELQQIGLSGGLDLWLYRNTGKLLEWSSAARDDWASGNNTDLLRRQVIRVLDYLDGTAYVGHDTPAGTPILVDPKVGRVGILEVDPNQALPSYLSHISLHLTGLVNAPVHTTSQQQIATKVDKEVQAVTILMQHIRQDAIQLVKMSNTELQQTKALSLLNDMVTNTNTAYVGQQDPTTGQAQGGVTWIHGQLQLLAAVPITTATPGQQ